MSNETQQSRRERLNDNSKELLDAIDDLHTLETSKRAVLVSTPAFHDLADKIQRKSRSIFGMATSEVEQAEEVAGRGSRDGGGVARRHRRRSHG